MAKAINKFNLVITRSNALLDFSEENPNNPISDEAIRMAVVLTIAGMDNFFTMKFRDIITKYLSYEHPGDDLINLLESAGLNARTALELIWMDRPLRRIGTLIERHFDRYTTQRFDVIDDLFKCVGINNLCENAEKKTGRTTLRSSITKLTEKRHLIVHDGDVNSRKQTREIDGRKMRRRIQDVEKFVNACDFILENKMKNYK